jgi:hypothetical protein
LPDSINVLALQDPRLFYDLLLVSNALKSLEKPKKSNWDDCGFAQGTEPVLHPPALHRTRLAG